MSKKGFTLVELLAVIAILAILVIIALPNILKMFNNAKKDIFLTEAKNIYKEVTKKYINETMRGNKISTTPSTKESNQPISNLHSAQLDTNSIRPSKHPFDHHKERQLENDPIIKLKKAILLANSQQLQQADKQIKNSITKQIDDDYQF